MTTYIPNRHTNLKVANIPDDFGPVVFLFDQYGFHAPSLDDDFVRDDYVSQILAKLKEFDPQTDQVLLFGDPTTSACMASVITGATNGVLPLLRFNNQLQRFERHVVGGL